MRYCPLSSVDGMVTFAGLPSTGWGTRQGMSTKDTRDEHTDVLLVPCHVTRFKARLLDLEPFGIGRVVLVACSIYARCHVRHDRTDVVWPLHATIQIS